MVDLAFYKGKTVLITGHTGFKGAWLSKILINAGANVVGYSLEAPTRPNLFTISNIEKDMNSLIGDIRDFESLQKVFLDYKPEIVFHLAAQPIVRDSYKFPRYTYETNIMGTVNVCECAREYDSVKSFLNITTDKVYENREWEWGYRENEPLCGFDPYSNSKSCAELVTRSYINSFFDLGHVAASTARAGNVIGGGDFANDRIIPDCVRAIQNQEKIYLRNPNSIRPYQHVLDALFAYLMIAEKQAVNKEFMGAYNIGPDYSDCITTKQLVIMLCSEWGGNVEWEEKKQQGPHEANFLKLDCSKLKNTFNWNPRWNINEAIKETALWYKAYLAKESMPEFMDLQIFSFLNGGTQK